ncbi:MAG: TldD/PmbA family protein, partial [Elusimicrobia bacterium]|nr:TldD/PmbA family protein [Elusimicrobiota bacterium]
MDWKKIIPLLTYGDYSELYSEESSGLHISYEDMKIEEVESGESSGMGLRYVQDGETRFGHLDGWNEEGLKHLSHGLSEGLKSLPPADWKGAVPHFRHPVLVEPASVPMDAKVKILSDADRSARSVEGKEWIRQVSISYGERSKKIHCFSVEDQAHSCYHEERVFMVFAVTVVAEKDGILQTATEVAGSLCGFELFEWENPSRIAAVAAQRAIQKLRSPPAPVGEMPVILESQAGGTMIHEAIGHSLEADGIQKGISPVYAGKIGTVVASEKISVFDDPTLPSHRGSFLFDDEGTKAERTVLVERGVLKNFLYDRITARKDGRPSNGHGRRESYSHKPIPRMSNTFVLSGPDDPQEILRSVPEGLLVRRMGGGQVNPVTGDFVFEVEEGYLLRGGQIQTMVRGASLLGNGPQVLRTIDLVGNDMGWGVGTCGKDGQGVP